ncbi:hypothetical protein Vafri_11940 [Volvox africanus]|uniref:Uncharacterized protein n=1 Tax=Volvox africanus TaxID=51714 RepID=A0A8J4B989_9CHLO|nr:hypothetical protein Vafri_11940 [Volvox africanus]
MLLVSRTTIGTIVLICSSPDQWILLKDQMHHELLAYNKCEYREFKVHDFTPVLYGTYIPQKRGLQQVSTLQLFLVQLPGPTTSFIVREEGSEMKRKVQIGSRIICSL